MNRNSDKALQREHLLQTLDTAGWLMIELRLQYMLMSYREALEQDQTHEDTVALRGKIAAIKAALEVPFILKKELSM